MAKVKTVFCCAECGATAPQWQGQCRECQGWNTLSEVTKPPSKGMGYAGQAVPDVTSLGQIQAEALQRMRSGFSELDHVLGGGVVPGAAILIGGDPGIGKSTLLLQLTAQLSAERTVLYVTGEESLPQVALRAQRLGVGAADISLFSHTQVEHIIATCQRLKPAVVVVDSIQTIFTEQLSSAPGSVSQVRESAAQLVRYAKQNNCTLFIVGHVTKEGAIAGPRVLEHMVDTVLYFESQSSARYRLLRAVKNRFGAINELAIFAMTERGLKQVNNPSAIFLTRGDTVVPGSVVMSSWEGTRPLLVEVQALVDSSQLGNPRRVTVGLEHNRLAMLLAVMHRHCQVVTADQDVFVNAVGGVRLTETGADLAIVLAVLSSLKQRPLGHEWIVFGEIGLSGELRPVPNGEARLREAAKHGFKGAIIPAGNMPKQAPEGMQVVAAKTLSGVLAHEVF